MVETSWNLGTYSNIYLITIGYKNLRGESTPMCLVYFIFRRIQQSNYILYNRFDKLLGFLLRLVYWCSLHMTVKCPVRCKDVAQRSEQEETAKYWEATQAVMGQFL